jgi:hypothetical protein
MSIDRGIDEALLELERLGWSVGFEKVAGMMRWTDDIRLSMAFIGPPLPILHMLVGWTPKAKAWVAEAPSASLLHATMVEFPLREVDDPVARDWIIRMPFAEVEDAGPWIAGATSRTLRVAICRSIEGFDRLSKESIKSLWAAIWRVPLEDLRSRATAEIAVLLE